MDNNIQITRKEFENLLKVKFNMEMVKDVLLKRAQLDWTKKYLTWNDETTSSVLRHIIGNAYDKRLEELTNKEDDE